MEGDIPKWVGGTLHTKTEDDAIITCTLSSAHGRRDAWLVLGVCGAMLVCLNAVCSGEVALARTSYISLERRGSEAGLSTGQRAVLLSVRYKATP